MLFGLLVSFGGRLGLQLDNETVGLLLAPILVYIVGQGFADTGKTAALINASVEAKQTAASQVEDKR